MRIKNSKLLSLFLSLCLMLSMTYGITYKVKAEYTFKELTQKIVDGLGGKLTLQNNEVLKLSEDIAINNDLIIDTLSDNEGIIELNGYKITVASGKKLSTANNVHINCYDNAARDNESGALVVNGTLVMNGTTIDVPNKTAIEVKTGGNFDTSNSVISSNLYGISSEGQCYIRGNTTLNVSDSENGTGIKVGAAGIAVILNYSKVNAHKSFDNSLGGKIYNFKNIIKRTPDKCGYLPNTYVNLSYESINAVNAAASNIKYTIDGTEPTSETTKELNSNNSSAGFVFNDTMTVKMLAMIDGQSYQLEPLVLNKGVDNESDFINAFNNIKATGGDIYLADSFAITDTIILQSEKPVYIHTGSNQIVINRGNLTLDKFITVDGYGADVSTPTSVILTVNGGILNINDGAIIRATSDYGYAVSGNKGGRINMSGGAVYAIKAAVCVSDDNLGQNTSFTMTGGYLEASGQGAAGIYALNGAQATIENGSIRTYGEDSFGVCAYDHSNVVIKGSSIVNSEGQRGMGVTTDHYAIVTLDENCIINSKDENSTAVISHENGTVNILSGTINSFGKNGTAISVDGMKDGTITDAVANISGGKINVQGEEGTGVSSKSNAHVTISGNPEINATGLNSSGTSAWDGGNIVIKGNTVINANAEGSKAALSMDNGKIEVLENAVLNSYGKNGRGIVVDGTKDTTFTDAFATISGGKINVQGDGGFGILTRCIAHTIISGNTEINVNAISGYGIAICDSGNTIIKGNTIINANAEGSAAAATSYNGNLQVSENTVINSSVTSGRGIIVQPYGILNYINGTINVYSDYGVGIDASASGMDSTVNISGGKINLNNSNESGISASLDSHVNVFGNAEVNVNSNNDYGLVSDNNGNIILKGDAVINVNSDATNSNAAYSSNNGNLQILENATLNSFGTDDCVIFVNKNGNVNFINGTINVNGQRTDGVRVNADNDSAKFTMSSGTINVSPNNSYGINAMNKGAVELNGSSNIKATGIAVNCHDNASITVKDSAVIESTGANACGIFAGQNGIVNILGNAEVDALGENSIALCSQNKGEITLQGSAKISANDAYGTALECIFDGNIIVKDSPVINANGSNGIGTNSKFGGKTDIQGTPVISTNGEKGDAVVVGTGGNANIQGGTINSKAFGLNVYSDDKISSILTVNSSVTVNVTDNDGLGIILKGEGATAMVGNLILVAPKEETVDYGTPISAITLEPYIPYVSGNIGINWYKEDYNGNIAGKHEVSGTASCPLGININKNIYLSKTINVNYSSKDVNHDAVVDIKDLSLVAKNYNLKAGAANWDSKLDVNGDNIIDLFDLVKVSREMRL